MTKEYSSIENAYTGIVNADRRVDDLIEAEDSFLNKKLEHISDKEDPVDYRLEAKKSFEKGYDLFNEALEAGLEKSEIEDKLDDSIDHFQNGEKAHHRYVSDLMQPFIEEEEITGRMQDEASELSDIQETVDTAVRDIEELKETILMPKSYNV